MSQSTSHKRDMENKFKILTFQSKLSCKRDGKPVMYFSNIVEIKCLDSTKTSISFKIKRQPTCANYPPCIQPKKKYSCNFLPSCKQCDHVGRQGISCRQKNTCNIMPCQQRSRRASCKPCSRHKLIDHNK